MSVELHPDPNGVASGETSLPRLSVTGTQALVGGRLQLGFFTAVKPEQVVTLSIPSGAAAGATPSLVRMGLYVIAADGSSTLIASTANDTTLLAAANTAYKRNVTTPTAKIAGQRYALGLLVVTAATLPSVYGNWAVSGIAGALGPTGSPRLGGFLTGQTDLPAAFTDASLGSIGPLLMGCGPS